LIGIDGVIAWQKDPRLRNDVNIRQQNLGRNSEVVKSMRYFFGWEKKIRAAAFSGPLLHEKAARAFSRVYLVGCERNAMARRTAGGSGAGTAGF
jgi:hypothetical protein